MANVFMSYARADRNRIQVLAESLKSKGWTVWWDYDLVAGSEYETVIQTELDGAQSVVVAWSAASVKSAWVRNEADEGLKRKILIPIILDESRPPLAFRHIQSISFAGGVVSDASPAVEELCRAVAHVLGKSGLLDEDLALAKQIAEAPLLSVEEEAFSKTLPPEQRAMMLLQARKQREQLITTTLTKLMEMRKRS